MFFLKYNKLTIGIVLMLVLLAGWASTNIYFFHDLDRFLPKDRNDHQFLQKFQAELEPDENYFLIGIKNEPSVFQADFLNKVHELTQAADSLPHVLQVQALTNMSRALNTPFGMTSIDMLHYDNPSKYATDSVRIMQNEHLVSRFISPDAKSLIIALKTAYPLGQKTSTALDSGVKTLLNDHFDFKEYHLAGKANVQTEFIALIEGEIGINLILCNTFLLIALSLILRRFWPVLIAYVSVTLGTILFAGVLGIMGKPLDLMAMLLPPLMLIVGMSDVIHFLSKYVDEIRAGKEKMAAMILTIKEIGIATLLTSITTAVGFGSLYFSQIEPIRNFGLTATIGVFVAYFTVLFFTTSALIILKPEQLISDKSLDIFWHKLMRWNYLFVYKNTNKILYTTFFVIAFCVFGMMNISTNAFLLSDVPNDSRLMNDFRFFEGEFNGIRSYELALLPQGDKKVNDLEVMQEVEKLKNYLKSNTLIESIFTPNTIYKNLNQAYNGGKKEAFVLPNKDKTIKKYDKVINRIPSSKLKVLFNKEKTLGRLTGLMLDSGSDNIRALNQQIKDWVDANINTELIRVQATGTALMVDKNNEYLRTSLIQSLGFALVVVSFLMGLVFRDIRMVFISLVPNIVPLIFTAAVVGLVGIELKASTSIIFAIAFGIAVDDTIHFLSKYKIEREKGYSVKGSVYNTYMETGKAICLTTIILFFGFSLLIFSNFNAVFYIGFLIGLTLLAALVTCMTLTPIFITKILGYYVEKDKQQ